MDHKNILLLLSFLILFFSSEKAFAFNVKAVSCQDKTTLSMHKKLERQIQIAEDKMYALDSKSPKKNEASRTSLITIYSNLLPEQKK